MKNELSEILEIIKRRLELEGLSGINEYPLSEKTNVSGTDMVSLADEVGGCTACDLYKTRKNVVFGSGNFRAKLMFVGEAPGMDEDIQGLPFVGKAGQLLTKIIEAMGLKRKDVYIANILKCRPPQNRNPFPTEVLACEGYLIRQIELIKPKVICALGKFAAQTLIRSQEPISKLRGAYGDYNGIKVMPTFHPAYLLRNPEDKRLVWEDIKKIQKFLSED